MRKFLIFLLVLTGIGFLAHLLTHHHAGAQQSWEDLLAEVPTPDYEDTIPVEANNRA